MNLATVVNGKPDGRLVAVSVDGQRFVGADDVAPNLQHALENWATVLPSLRALAANEGEMLAGQTLCAPLPRAWQWLDGSAFETHGKLMQIAFGLDPIPGDRPLMYQGMSDRFYGPRDDVPMTDEALGIDFVHFGIVAVVNCMIGLLTPPFGLLLFVMQSITKLPMRDIVRELVPFLVALIGALGLITYWPTLVLFVPRLLGYKG